MGHPVAIVTGAARGIGHACVERLVSDGYYVVAIDLDTSPMVNMQQDKQVEIHDLDVTDVEAGRNLVNDVSQRLGGANALVNNAGYGERVPIENMETAIWRRMFEEIPSPNFGLNFDPSHLVWLQIDYLKPLREFSEKIFHLHAKDVRVDRHRLDEVGILGYPLEYHTPKLPGLGDVNWGQFFSVLSDVGYQGAVCIEVEDRAYEAVSYTHLTLPTNREV